MIQLRNKLLDYLETVSGERPDMTAANPSALPLFLRERYTFFSARLFGRKAILALEAEDWEGGSPGEYGKHASTLSAKLSEPVILVLPVLPSHARNKMVQMGIPFIVPGHQTFVPGGLLDLRERFPRPAATRRERLSPAAQYTLLYHLTRKPLSGIALKDIARITAYSPMMTNKVKDELEAAAICSTVRNGRAMTLEFATHGRALWEQAQPLLASPVKKTRWIQWNKPVPAARLAGLSALSLKTMIADDRLPTYALVYGTFQHLLEQGALTGCTDADTAKAKIEVWSYDPIELGDDQTVDALSLYLSLRHSGDERIQHELERVLEKVTW